MTESLTVTEGGRIITFTFADMMRFHGLHSPGGVAMAFKVMQRAFAELSPTSPPARRDILVRTAFRGPGARDGFEAVTRAVSDGRYTVDRCLLRADLGRLREDFVFEVGLAGAAVTMVLREGYVDDEFLDLARTDTRSEAQEHRLDELKTRLAQLVMSTPADDVYDLARSREQTQRTGQSPLMG